MNLCLSCVYDQVHSFGSIFYSPPLFKLRGTDNKIRTIKKLKIYVIFLCFRENEVRSFSHFIIKAESQEERSIKIIKIDRTCAIPYYVTTRLYQF